jgi:ATP-binding cassette subfamily B protein
MLKKFISYYKPYKLLFFADIFCAVAVAAIDLVFPQVLRYITTGGLFSDNANVLKTVIFISLGLFILYILRSLCQYFITSWGHVMGARMERDMRQNLFYHYQRLSFSYYDKNNTGEMISKLVTDLFDISEFAHHGPENILISLLKIIGAIVILASINPYITLVLAVIVFFMIAFSIVMNRRHMSKIYYENSKKIAAVNAGVQDSLLGIKVIKSFAREGAEHKKFDAANAEYLSTKSLSYKTMGKYHGVNSFFQGLLYIAALVSGGIFFVQNNLGAMEFAMYFLYIGIFISPIEMLINFTELFHRGYTGFKRYDEVINAPTEPEDCPSAVELTVCDGKIEYKNVSFSYENGENVLNGVSFSAEKGQTIALVGSSGGGKTTVCSLLPRFYDADGGEILIDGKNIKEFTLKSLRRAIGIVQQDVYMFNGTIRENIAYGKTDATDQEIIDAAKRANIDDFIMSLPSGYDTDVGERGTRLSGGQRQRISIARVFLKNPPILLLDEATSSLDNESERQIQKSLDELSADRTAIVIAHRLGTVRNADKIYVIDGGKILESGTHDGLLRLGGRYAEYIRLSAEPLPE